MGVQTGALGQQPRSAVYKMRKKNKKTTTKKEVSHTFNFLTILLLAAIVIIITNLLPEKTAQKAKESKPENATTPTPFPEVSYELPEIPTTEKIKVSGIEIKNFYKEAISVGEHIGDTLLVDKVEYKIIYYPLDKAFLIIVLRWPFEDIRENAEEDFLETLEISKSQACELSVYITTPAYANPEYAGKNWRLSWCE